MKKYKDYKTMGLKKGAKYKHMTGEYESYGELISIHGETDDCYIGNEVSVCGMLLIECEYRKEDCIEMSKEEVKQYFRDSSLYRESDYKRWFGVDINE